MILTIPTMDDRTIKVRDGDEIYVCKFKKGKCKMPDKRAKAVLKLVDFIHAEKQDTKDQEDE